MGNRRRSRQVIMYKLHHFSAKCMLKTLHCVSTFFDLLRLYFSILKYVGQHLFFGAVNIFSIHRAAVISIRLLQRIRITIYPLLLFARRCYESYSAHHSEFFCANACYFRFRVFSRFNQTNLKSRLFLFLVRLINM